MFALSYDPSLVTKGPNPGAPQGYRNAGLFFQMELPNSSWNAREAFSEISTLVRRANFVVEDADASRGMQSEDGKPAVPYLKPDGNLEEDLLLRWRRSCRHEIAYLRMAGTKVPYVPEDAVRRWWEFSSVEHLLTGQISSRVKVSPMFIAEHPRTKEPVTGTVWPYGSPMVIPRCDVLLVLQPPTGILSRLVGRVTAILIPYKDLATRLERFLLPFEGPPPLKDLLILTPEQAVMAKAEIPTIHAERIDPISLRYIHEEPFSDIALRE
jgi:hypothetical protein